MESKTGLADVSSKVVVLESHAPAQVFDETSHHAMQTNTLMDTGQVITGVDLASDPRMPTLLEAAS